MQLKNRKRIFKKGIQEKGGKISEQTERQQNTRVQRNSHWTGKGEAWSRPKPARCCRRARRVMRARPRLWSRSEAASAAPTAAPAAAALASASAPRQIVAGSIGKFWPRFTVGQPRPMSASFSVNPAVHVNKNSEVATRYRPHRVPKVPKARSTCRLFCTFLSTFYVESATTIQQNSRLDKRENHGVGAHVEIQHVRTFLTCFTSNAQVRV